VLSKRSRDDEPASADRVVLDDDDELPGAVGVLGDVDTSISSYKIKVETVKTF
jgi:hypothetical protein